MAETDPSFDDPRFRFKPIPLLVTSALAFGAPIAGAYAAHCAIVIPRLPIAPGGNLCWLFAHHAGELLVALIVIGALK